jgi:hypothetical protein
MGQGFPQIPTRFSFGPTYRNKDPLQFPEKELSAEEINLAAWQEHLMGTTMPSAVLIGADLGPWAITFASQTFDPKEILDPPAVVLVGTVLELTFPAQQVNEDGELRRFFPMVASALPHYATPAAQLAATPRDIVTFVRGQVVGIEFRALGGAPVAPEGALIQVWGTS